MTISNVSKIAEDFIEKAKYKLIFYISYLFLISYVFYTSEILEGVWISGFMDCSEQSWCIEDINSIKCRENLLLTA